MPVLVTGANGLLGNNLCRELLEQGHDVRAMVRRSSNLNGLKGLPVDVHYGDVRDADAIRSAAEGCDGKRRISSRHRFRVHAHLCVRGSFASRQDGFAYFRRRFGIFCRRGGAHGFFLRRVGRVARMHPSCHRARFLAVLLSTFGLTVIPSFAVDGGKRWDFL